LAKRTLKSTALGLVRLTRPPNSLMVGFAVVVGMLIAMGGVFNGSLVVRGLLGFIAGFTLSGTAMAVNDYYDREVDLVNEPSRPIPSGVVKPREALALASLLAALGLGASALINLQCLALATLAGVVAVSYASVGKATGLPGNAMVSFCVALPFIYGGVAVGKLTPVLFTFAGIAFLANMGREVAKGIVDVVGDATRGVKTVATVYGRRAAAKTAASFFISAAALSIVPWAMGMVGLLYLPLVTVCDVGLARCSLALLRDPSREVARRVKREVLVWMLIGLAAFMAGTLLR